MIERLSGITLAEAVKELMLERGLDMISDLEIEYEVAAAVLENQKRFDIPSTLPLGLDS